MPWAVQVGSNPFNLPRKIPAIHSNVKRKRFRNVLFSTSVKTNGFVLNQFRHVGCFEDGKKLKRPKFNDLHPVRTNLFAKIFSLNFILLFTVCCNHLRTPTNIFKLKKYAFSIMQAWIRHPTLDGKIVRTIKTGRCQTIRQTIADVPHFHFSF